MTIKGLWTFIKNKHPRCLMMTPRISFSGYSIAIDAYNFFYIYYSVAYKQVVYDTQVIDDEVDQERVNKLWLSKVLEEIITMIDSGITPILVMDGPPVSDKSDTLESRSSTRQKARDELEQYRTIALNNKWDPKITGKIRKLLCSSSGISRDCMNLAENFFTNLGIPVVTAIDDGERLCAALCREGKAAATYTSDSDGLAHLSPIQIKRSRPKMITPDNIIYTGYEVVMLDMLLDDMNMDRSTFQEFCILCGCDYNTNIPGIGPVTASRLIAKHQTIEQIPSLESKTDTLRVERSRELLQPVDSKELIKRGSLDIEKWHDGMATHLEQHQMGGYVGRWKTTLDYHTPPKHFTHRSKIRIAPGLCLVEDKHDDIPNLYSLSQVSFI